VAEAEFFETFVDSSPGEWIQTSYNTHGGKHYNPDTKELSNDQTKALRKNYARIGWTYNIDRDAFIPPKPYSSWIINEQTCLWEAPVAYPNDENSYVWNETLLNWEMAPDYEVE
jgi:hypothetical protein